MIKTTPAITIETDDDITELEISEV